MFKFVLGASTCEECEAQLLTVIYKSDQTKFKDGSDEKTGCVFCTADFMPLIEKHRAISSRPAHASMRGGRGGGGSAAMSTRGGVGGGGVAGGAVIGGRGGGRGRAPKDKMAQLAAYFV